MAHPTLEHESVPEPAVAPRRDRSGIAGLGMAWTVVAIAAGMLVLSLLVVLWARTRPGYDPYGWLVWGRQTILGHLDTNAAPSWKPLPYLFTLPYALFGALPAVAVDDHRGGDLAQRRASSPRGSPTS